MKRSYMMHKTFFHKNIIVENELNYFELEAIRDYIKKHPFLYTELNDEEYIEEIERALNVKLYNEQITNLLSDKPISSESRAVGKSIVYYIKLALSEGDPILIRHPSRFINDYGTGSLELNDTYHKVRFMDIHTKLKAYSFRVIDVLFV